MRGITVPKDNERCKNLINELDKRSWLNTMRSYRTFEYFPNFSRKSGQFVTFSIV